MIRTVYIFPPGLKIERDYGISRSKYTEEAAAFRSADEKEEKRRKGGRTRERRGWKAEWEEMERGAKLAFSIPKNL